MDHLTTLHYRCPCTVSYAGSCLDDNRPLRPCFVAGEERDGAHMSPGSDWGDEKRGIAIGGGVDGPGPGAGGG